MTNYNAQAEFFNNNAFKRGNTDNLLASLSTFSQANRQAQNLKSHQSSKIVEKKRKASSKRGYKITEKVNTLMQRFLIFMSQNSKISDQFLALLAR